MTNSILDACGTYNSRLRLYEREYLNVEYNSESTVEYSERADEVEELRLTMFHVKHLRCWELEC